MHPAASMLLAQKLGTTWPIHRARSLSDELGRRRAVPGPNAYVRTGTSDRRARPTGPDLTTLKSPRQSPTAISGTGKAIVRTATTGGSRFGRKRKRRTLGQAMDLGEGSAWNPFGSLAKITGTDRST